MDEETNKNRTGGREEEAGRRRSLGGRRRGQRRNCSWYIICEKRINKLINYKIGGEEDAGHPSLDSTNLLSHTHILTNTSTQNSTVM